ncbi:MAG: threonylcarbamoyl-AMP synthase [Chitinophagales bacterium]|nr:threonylcarbamoyl-AMP synthase [Chitinophagales bacterium]
MMYEQEDIELALETLRKGGLLLYPTDTIWGIGCDATNRSAVEKVYALKKREDTKALIVLVAEERDIYEYTAAPDPEIFDYLERTSRPTTVVYQGALGLAENLIAQDGSVGIRICRDPFCRALIKRLQKPMVSTSANISGQPAPGWFGEVSEEVKSGVDYIVKYRQDDREPATPSSVVRFRQGQVEILR